VFFRKVKRLQERLTNRIGELGISASARRVRHEGLTYLTIQKIKRIEKTIKDVLDSGVKGDVVEFGIALGGSAIILAGFARNAHRRFQGFDVFGMIPEPGSEKDDEGSKARYRTIASGKSTGINGEIYYGYRSNLFDEVCNSFKNAGVPVDGGMIQLHKGLFEQTVPSAITGQISFAHVDCDWYDPVRFCLNSIADLVPGGGAIVLDDYNDYGGCRTATDEFLKARPEFEFQNGANVILRRRR